jgi:hypothetical protein
MGMITTESGADPIILEACYLIILQIFGYSELIMDALHVFKEINPY